MNKETVLRANKLYEKLEDVSLQIEKLEKLDNQSLLITIHLSIDLHIDNVAQDYILSLLYKEKEKLTKDLHDLGCEA